jgi:hypothetical protein
MEAIRFITDGGHRFDMAIQILHANLARLISNGDSLVDPPPRPVGDESEPVPVPLASDNPIDPPPRPVGNESEPVPSLR